MIRLLLFFIFYSCASTFAQQDPKNIISNEKNTILIEQDVKKIEQDSIEEDSNPLSESNISSNLEENYLENSTEQTDDKSSIVVKDIPNKDNNSWYGTLSSDNEGLGWMMWGNTSFSLSKDLIDRINSSTDSSTLRFLLKNLILSRAKSPAVKSNESLDSIESTNIQASNKLPYFEKKVFHLINTGFNKDIEKLISSIPQDFRNKEFDKNHFNLRLNSFDIPYVCNNISKMLGAGENLIFYRKILIVCKFILKRKEEATLALELLENDIENEDKFIDNAINYLGKIKNNNLDFDSIPEEKNHLLKILSFYNYNASKKTFSNKPILFHKTIYDLKLFTKELQIESLEFLVNQNIYGPSLLIKEYKDLIASEEIDSYIKNHNQKGNSAKLRAASFQIISNTLSSTDRAKNLMKLWKLAEEKNILRAISLITKNLTMSLSPDPTLNWFNLPAAKALILSDETEASKKWIFFGTSDIKERASIDINFCRLLIFTYLHDSNILNYRSQTVDLSFLLKILKNDLNTDDKGFLKLIVTLNALGEEIPSEMWKMFFSNEAISLESFNFIRNDYSNYFMLDNAINNNNLAESALLSISLLQKEIGFYKEMYSFYKGLEGLNLIGLESYARSYAMEKNFNFLAK